MKHGFVFPVKSRELFARIAYGLLTNKLVWVVEEAFFWGRGEDSCTSAAAGRLQIADGRAGAVEERDVSCLTDSK